MDISQMDISPMNNVTCTGPLMYRTTGVQKQEAIKISCKAHQGKHDAVYHFSTYPQWTTSYAPVL